MNSIPRIGIDAMGGDFGPGPVAEGAALALKEWPGRFALTLVGDEAEIRSFCSLNYEVSFPLFAKIEVNGASAHPLYQVLKSAAPGILGTEAIKWNFTKFLLDGQGRVVARYAPTDTPESLEKDVLALLDA